MSSVIDIVFERRVKGFEVADWYDFASVYFEDEFEALAKRLGVTHLGAFYSDDPNSLDDAFDEDFFDDPKELDQLKEKMGPEEFFDPGDALKSVTVLRDYLKKGLSSRKKSERKEVDFASDNLVDELTQVETALKLAKAQGVKFHFVLTPD